LFGFTQGVALGWIEAAPLALTEARDAVQKGCGFQI
jgi:hypothetical protein